MVSEPGAKASRKPATRTCDESSWKLRGAIVVTLHLARIAQAQESVSEEAKDSSRRLEPEQRLSPSSKSQPDHSSSANGCPTILATPQK